MRLDGDDLALAEEGIGFTAGKEFFYLQEGEPFFSVFMLEK